MAVCRTHSDDLISPGTILLAVMRRIMVIGAIGGMIAGMMLAMVEMLYGAFNLTRSFWDSPMAIWSWVFGQEHFTQNDPGAHVGPVILGIGAHMVNSMLFGIAFATLMVLLRPRVLMTPIMIGVTFGLGSWAIMRYGILPLNAGEADLFTTDIVSPAWVWWLGHAVLGMVAGMYYLVIRRALPQRGARARSHGAERSIVEASFPEQSARGTG